MPLEPDPTVAPAPEPPRGSLWKAAPLAVGTAVARDIVAPGLEVMAGMTGNDSGPLAESARIARTVAGAIDEMIPADRRRDRDATFIPDAEKGEQSVFKNPFSSLVMKTASAAPSLGAYVAAGPAAPIVGAAQGVGQRISDTKGLIENASDEELTKKYPSFAEDVNMGLPSDLARKKLAADLASPGNLTIAGAGGALGATGVSAAFRQTVGRTFPRAVGVGALEAAGGGAAQGAAVEGARQEGDVRMGAQEDYDVPEIVRAGANAGLENKVFGGVLGGAHSVMHRPPKAADVTPPGKGRLNTAEPIGDGNAPSTEQRAALDASNAPKETKETTALDQQIADAGGAAEPPVAPTAPKVEAKAPSPAPTEPAAPKTPKAPVVETPVEGHDLIRNSVLAAARERMGMVELQGRVRRDLEAQGVPVPSYGDFLKVVQRMVGDGDLTKRAGGYKVTKAPRVEAPVVEPPVPGDAPSKIAAEAPTGLPTKTEPVAPPVVPPAAPIVAPTTAEPRPTRAAWKERIVERMQQTEDRIRAEQGEEGVAAWREANKARFERVRAASDKIAGITKKMDADRAAFVANPPKLETPKLTEIAKVKPVAENNEQATRNAIAATSDTTTRNAIQHNGMAALADPLGWPLDLKHVGVGREAIAALEHAGLAKDGAMTLKQWEAWDAHRAASATNPPAPAAVTPPGNGAEVKRLVAKAKKPPTKIQAKVAEVATATGKPVEAGASTTVKVERKVLKAKKDLEAKKAEEAAAIAKARAEGKPVVLKAKPTEEAIIKKAVDEHRTTEAERKRAERAERTKNDEVRAKEMAHELWRGEGKAIDENALSAQDASAARNEPQGIQAVLSRARLVVANAENNGLAIMRRERAYSAGEIDRPWHAYIAEANHFVETYERAIQRKEQKTAREALERFVAVDRAMRSGEENAARDARRERIEESNSRFKKVDTETAGIEDMAGAKSAVERVADGEDVGKPDATNYEDPQEARRGNGASKNSRKFIDATSHLPAVSLENALSGVRIGGEPRTAAGIQAIQRIMGVRKRVLEIAGKHTEVRFVPDAVMAEHFGPNVEGVHFAPTIKGAANGARSLIYIRESSRNDHRVLLHEGVHAATSYAIDHNAGFKSDVEDLMILIQLHGAERLAGAPDSMIANFLGEYGFKNEHEFIAEALSNPDFQSALQAIELPRKAMEVTRWGNIVTVWDKFVHAVAKVLGLNRGKSAMEAGLHEASYVNALEVAMRAGGEALYTHEQLFDTARRGELKASTAASEPQMLTRRDVADYFEQRIPGRSDWKLRVQRGLDKLATFTQLANNSDHLFGPGTPARELADKLARAATEKDKILREGGEPVVQKLHELQRKYDQRDASGNSTFTRFAELAYDATVAQVHPNMTLDENGLSAGHTGWYGKHVYADLASRYNALPADLKAAYKDMIKYASDTQNAMSLQLIKNTLKAMSPDGKGSDALAQRIHERKLTEADKQVLGKDGAYRTIMEATRLSKIRGPYIPLMRRGDIIVQGRYDIPEPRNGVRMDASEKVTSEGNIFEFKTEADAKAYVEKLADEGFAAPEVSKVYVDPDTNSRYYEGEDGSRKRLGKEETNAELRYRVTVQDKHVEFHPDVKSAAKAREGLIANGLKDVAQLDIKRDDANALDRAHMPQQIQTMLNALKKSDGFKALGEAAQREAVRLLHEQSLMAMAATRVQTKRLPRNNVLGYSTDIVRNMGEYANSSSGYLARLKHQPAIDALLKQMREYTDKAAYHGNEDGTQLERRARLKEMERRVTSMHDPEPHTLFHRIGNRLLQISYLDKLASPAFHIINAMEPWTIAFPVLAAKHGVGAALREMKRAYSDIGAMSTLGAGFRDTGRAATKHFVNEGGLTDHLGKITDRLKKAPDGNDVVRALDHLSDVGLLSRDAGLELGRLVDPSASLLGRGLDRGDLMARQMGTAIEMVNRSVVAVAAYRMERARGSGHEAALKHMTEAVHDTMKDYASWNAAPIFQHPVGRLALQFRKYAQGTYYLLGKQAMAAFKGDREAMKAFAGLMATHMVTAGALGLPLEVIKLGMLGAGMAGITDKTYEDFEHGVRKGAANVFGKAGGEVFTRGLPRYLGIDLAQRVSLNNLLLGGQDPKSYKQDDMYAWLAKNFAGAPASYVLDAVQGFQELGKGNVVEATRLIMPLKIYADSIQAYQMATEGKKTPSGRELAKPYTTSQAIVKVLGFQPGDPAESQEQAFATRREQKRLHGDRQGAINRWVEASPADKQTMWKEIVEWNKGKPAATQITGAELSRAMQRRREESNKKDYSKGLRTTARDRHLREANDFYNVAN